ncbi:hypothetical protein M758_6G075800 [Ceratodon purpureus]|nr:hypothetical protein M758_6G075800 [Ceratodon purpureus]
MGGWRPSAFVLVPKLLLVPMINVLAQGLNSCRRPPSCNRLCMGRI